MEKNKYLPAGATIAKKYEVVDVLGEDEFEILYLVRDINRIGSFFVLKELFLETFSSREGELVFTVPEALGVFHKRKKEIIEEIDDKKLNVKHGEIKIYGYEDENNTIYTIMEFSNNASLEKYLQFTPKDVKSLPVLDELLKKEKIFDYSLILKILLLIGLVLGIAFYTYTFFQKKSLDNNEYEFKKPVSENFPALKTRTKIVDTTTEVNSSKRVVAQSKIEVTEKDSLKKPEETLAQSQSKQIEVNKDVSMKIESNRTEVLSEKSEELILEPIIPDIVTEESSIKETDSNRSSNETVLSSVAFDSSLAEKSQNKKETVTEENTLVPVNTRLKEFLDEYITASATSVEGTIKFYDKKVKKYFRFNYPSHKTIVKSQKRYNKKWVHREFKILDFKLVKSYKKSGVNYYKLKTTTRWHVANKRGKKLSGKSRGMMTLREVGESFKITSIYTVK